MTSWLESYGEAAKTAVGFFWKAGWAFVLGYAISAMIEAFVPKKKLTRFMGSLDTKTIAISTAAGAVSSSCSFAALAAARSLFKKGAHFAAGVAFMFASTNLVIELGILILIFLGWQFLAAEIVGGLLLIAISTVLIRWTYPEAWIQNARDRLEADREEDEEFDWRERIRSRDGWRRVGRRFFMEWGMVWQDILIGFTVAGFMTTLVPESFWKALFLAEDGGTHASFLTVLENALIAPFVAAATFIGSMGNIPLATVLNNGGVLFAGIMGFIYSDLMVPPIVKVNARYYGWRVALYIAGVMFVSIVSTAIALHYTFALLGLTPESAKKVAEITEFKVDYTLWLNLVALAILGGMAFLRGTGRKEAAHGNENERRWGVQEVLSGLCAILLAAGLIVFAFSS